MGLTTAVSAALTGALGGAATIMGVYSAARFTTRGWTAATAVAATSGAALALVGSHWHRLSITDDATTLYNRRYLFNRLRQELRRTQRASDSLAFIVAEVDNMRSYNNTYGHLAGDAVLLAVSHTLNHGVRRGDIVARWGGDEFGVILPHTALADAAAIAERLRLLVEALTVAVGNDTTVHVTISVGVATSRASTRAIEDLIASADQAMYIAKQQKNLVVAAR